MGMYGNILDNLSSFVGNGFYFVLLLFLQPGKENGWQQGLIKCFWS